MSSTQSIRSTQTRRHRLHGIRSFGADAISSPLHWGSFLISPLIKSGSVAEARFPNQLAVIAADCRPRRGAVNHLLCSSAPLWRPVAPQQMERGEEHTAAPPTEHLTPQLPARQITAAESTHTNTHTFIIFPEEMLLPRGLFVEFNWDLRCCFVQLPTIKMSMEK